MLNGIPAGQPTLQRAGPGSGSTNSRSQSFTPKVKHLFFLSIQMLVLCSPLCIRGALDRCSLGIGNIQRRSEKEEGSCGRDSTAPCSCCALSMCAISGASSPCLGCINPFCEGSRYLSRWHVSIMQIATGFEDSAFPGSPGSAGVADASAQGELGGLLHALLPGTLASLPISTLANLQGRSHIVTTSDVEGRYFRCPCTLPEYPSWSSR